MLEVKLSSQLYISGSSEVLKEDRNPRKFSKFPTAPRAAQHLLLSVASLVYAIYTKVP